MASAEEIPAAEPLRCRIFGLRVPMHCDGCKRKVQRILQAMDGVYITSIDMAQQKVTVTGDIHPHVVIQKLTKFGKHVELWPEQRQPKNEEGEKERKEEERDGANDTDDGNSTRSEVDVADKNADGKKDGDANVANEVEESEPEGESEEKRRGEEEHVEEKAVGSGTGKGKRVKGGGGGGKNHRGQGEGLVKLPYCPSPMAEYTVSYCVAVHGSNPYGGWAPPVEVHHHHHHLRHSPTPPRPASPTPPKQPSCGNSFGAHSYSPAPPPPAAENEWYDMFSDENPNACRVM